MAQPNTKKKKKKKQMVRCLGPRDPHLPHLLPTTQFQNISFLSLSCHTFFVLLFFSFSLKTTHTHTPLTHSPTGKLHTTIFLHFFGQGSPKNFIGKAKAHSSLLFKVKISNLFMGIMLLLEVIFI